MIFCAFPTELLYIVSVDNTCPDRYGITLIYPGQPLLRLKQSHNPHNLLVNFGDEGLLICMLEFVTYTAFSYICAHDLYIARKVILFYHLGSLFGSYALVIFLICEEIYIYFFCSPTLIILLKQSSLKMKGAWALSSYLKIILKGASYIF